jgi:hypothetical protein
MRFAGISGRCQRENGLARARNHRAAKFCFRSQAAHASKREYNGIDLAGSVSKLQCVSQITLHLRFMKSVSVAPPAAYHFGRLGLRISTQHISADQDHPLWLLFKETAYHPAHQIIAWPRGTSCGIERLEVFHLTILCIGGDVHVLWRLSARRHLKLQQRFNKTSMFSLLRHCFIAGTRRVRLLFKHVISSSGNQRAQFSRRNLDFYRLLSVYGNFGVAKQQSMLHKIVCV